MEKAYVAPNILHLTGITLEDYVPVEDILDEQLMDRTACGAPDSSADAMPFDKIPAKFTGLEEWPLSTNLRCWDSGFTSDDRPKFVPTYIITNENGDFEIGVKGTFCTFNNAAGWIRRNIHSKDLQWKTLDMLCVVYKIFTGQSVSNIESAPEVTKMLAWGGDWDEDTYWRNLRALDPINGLKNHTPGSVRSERERMMKPAASPGQWRLRGRHNRCGASADPRYKIAFWLKRIRAREMLPRKWMHFSLH